MKITAFNPEYVVWLAQGTTTLDASTGSNAGYGPDVEGEAGDLSVVSLRQVVSLASNMGDNTLGSVLTTVQSSPWVAQFAVPSNAGASGSNSVTRTLGGQETVVTHAASGSTRALDVRGGNVFDVTLNDACSLSLIGEPASGLSCAITLLLRQDASGGRTVSWPGEIVWPNATTPSLSSAANAVDVFSLFTLDAGSTWFGFPTAASVSIGSNSTHVRETSTIGASTSLFSPFDHAHAGVGQITSSSSNTLQRGTVNLRMGNNIAFGVTDGDGDGELDTVTIHGTGGGGSSSGGIPAGTSFPGGPSADDLYYRTDRDILYFYSGSQWLSVTLYQQNLGSWDGITATANEQPVAVWAADYDIYIEKIISTMYAGSGLSGSAYWQLDFYFWDGATQGASQATQTNQSGTNATFERKSTTINALLGTGKDAITAKATKVSTPGTFFGGSFMTFRLVG